MHGCSGELQGDYIQSRKIEELKQLGDKKMHIEYDKIQTKLSSDSIKIIKDSIVGYKNNSEYFDAQLERHNSTMRFFFLYNF